MSAVHTHDQAILYQIPGVWMWEVRGEAGWEAELNSMCACIFILYPQPSWIVVGKMPEEIQLLHFTIPPTHMWLYTKKGP